MRRVILTVHLSVGLIAGVFILVLGLTGSVMAFEPELDRLLHPHLSYVKPSGRVLALGEIGEAVSKQFHGEPNVAYLPSEFPDLSAEAPLFHGGAKDRDDCRKRPGRILTTQDNFGVEEGAGDAGDDGD